MTLLISINEINCEIKNNTISFRSSGSRVSVSLWGPLVSGRQQTLYPWQWHTLSVGTVHLYEWPLHPCPVEMRQRWWLWGRQWWTRAGLRWDALLLTVHVLQRTWNPKSELKAVLCKHRLLIQNICQQLHIWFTKHAHRVQTDILCTFKGLLNLTLIFVHD